MVTLRLLGRISLTDPTGKEISSLLSQPKRVAVLAFLALQGRDGYLRRDLLMARFWAESDLSHARNALNQSLHILRGELGDGVVRTRGKNEVGLDPDLFTCDVWTFRAAVRDGRRQEALELYRGPLMPGFHLNGSGEFDRWLEGEREELREAAAGAAWILAHHQIQAGRPVKAERTAQRALALVWTDEFPVRRFISALAEAGDRAAAVRFYEKFRDRLREDLDLEPSPPTREVAEAIRNGDGTGSLTEALPTGLPSDPGGTGGAEWTGTSQGGRIPENIDIDEEGIGPDSAGHPHKGSGRHGPEASREPGASSGMRQPSVADHSRASPSESPARRHRGFWWAAAVLAPISALLLTVRSPGTRSSPPPDRPFTVLAAVAGTGDEGEREAVAFLLRTGLDMSHMLETVPGPDVARILTLMEHEERTPLNPSVAREVAMRLGAATVVLPRLDRMGRTYSLVVRLEDAATGELRAATRRQAAYPEAVVELVDSVVLDLREQLGEAREILSRREPLPQVLTGSLEALKEYRMARDAGPGRAQTAVRHLRRAVTADTAFAMAWQLMAALYGNYLNQPDSAELAKEQALRFQNRLTEARQQDGVLHRRIRGDIALWDVALDEAEAAMDRDSRFLNNYSVYTGVPGGLLDSVLNMRFRLEREGAENARRFNQDLPYEARCFINTHFLAAALDRMDEYYGLLDSMDMFLPPDCGREVALFESLAAGEWDRADSLVQHSPGDWRWPTGVDAALLQMVPLRGGIRAAHTLPSASPPATRGLRPDSSGFSNISHLILEVVYNLPIEETPWETLENRGEPKALESRGRDDVADFILYGVRESLLGDTAEAKRVAHRLRAMRDSATSRTFEGAFAPWFSLLEAGPAYQGEDWEAVQGLLSPMAKRMHQPKVGGLPGDDYLIWWLLAEAHIRLGDPRSAILNLESILERPRHRQQNWMLQGFIHPVARFKLARLYDQVGESETARDNYRVFLDTFTEPEAEFQWMVDEARAAYQPADSANDRESMTESHRSPTSDGVPLALHIKK